MAMSLDSFGPALNGLWKLMESYGIEPAPIFRKHNVDPEILLDTNARVSFQVVENGQDWVQIHRPRKGGPQLLPVPDSLTCWRGRASCGCDELCRSPRSWRRV